MRILHVLHSHGYGGAENHVMMMMRGQRDAGHTVCFAGPLDSWLGRACAEAGIEAVHIAMHGLYDLWSHWQLARLVRRWRPDIVHGHLIRGAAYAGRAGHLQRKPLAVCTAHATTAKTHMQRCAHIIAVSGAVKDKLVNAGYAAERISVVHNGVPEGPHGSAQGASDAHAAMRLALRDELGIPDGVFAVANAGRFIHDKGQDLLLQALAQTPGDAGQGVHLFLIGDPATEFGRSFEQALAQAPENVAARVHLLGYRKDVQRILPAFDAYALSSRREALPLSLVEAFAARLPVIATTVGGVPEIVLHERTGLQVPPENATALGQAMARLHADADLAARLAAAGRQHYEQELTAERMVERTLAVYTQALADAPRRILIVRLSALGDIVMASGLIPALKTRFPDAELSWVCEAGCVPLLKHNPRLKEVIVWPRSEWEALLKAKRYLALWQSVRAFRARLRAERFDLVLDGQGLLKSGLIAWFTGAPRRISIIAREGSHRLMHEVVTPTPGADPVMGSEYRFLARHLGAPQGSFVHDLAVGEAPQTRARHALEEALRARGLDGLTARPLVVLAPFTTRPQKHWVEPRWAELAQALWDQGLQPVVLGGPADRDAADRIVAELPQVPSLAGALKLDESVALIADAHLLVGVDTGLTHMGSALRVPTLALFGSTRPYLQGPTPLTRVMYDALPCSPCRRRPTCNGDFTCMKQLTVDRVTLQALELLALRESEPGLAAGGEA